MGGPGPPTHPSVLDFPGPSDGRSSPGGPAWGSAPVASGPAVREGSPASHPCSDLAAPGLPGGAARALGAPETVSRNCPRGSPARLWGPSQDSGRRRRAGAVTGSQAPGPPRLSPRGSPLRSHPPGSEAHSPPEAEPRPPAAPSPRPEPSPRTLGQRAGRRRRW